MATKRFPSRPSHPERLCWGCDRYCPAQSLACGNGSERTQHPVELFGDDWERWTDDGRPPDESHSGKAGPNVP